MGFYNEREVACAKNKTDVVKAVYYSTAKNLAVLSLAVAVSSGIKASDQKPWNN